MSETRKREKRLRAAEGYLALGMPDHALRELKPIERSPQTAATVSRLRAESLRQLERFTEALTAYSRVLAEQPQDVEVLMGMAWCYKRLDRIGEAITATEQAYQSDPENSILLYNLSCYFALAGERDQSLAWLGRALRMNQQLVNLVDDESDFDSLRNDAGFRFLVDGVRSAQEDLD